MSQPRIFIAKKADSARKELEQGFLSDGFEVICSADASELSECLGELDVHAVLIYPDVHKKEDTEQGVRDLLVKHSRNITAKRKHASVFLVDYESDSERRDELLELGLAAILPEQDPPSAIVHQVISWVFRQRRAAARFEIDGDAVFIVGDTEVSARIVELSETGVGFTVGGNSELGIGDEGVIRFSLHEFDVECRGVVRRKNSIRKFFRSRVRVGLELVHGEDTRRIISELLEVHQEIDTRVRLAMSSQYTSRY